MTSARRTPTPRPRRASTKRPTSSSPSALSVLTDDHRAVEKLFARFEGLGPKAHKTRQSLVEKTSQLVSTHAGIEEMVFYPDVRSKLEALNDTVLEALEEHHLVKMTLAELQGMRSEDERFAAKFTVLMECVRHHVKEEERELFPKVRKAFSRGELEALGERLLAAKSTAPKRPHPESPDTPPGNVVATALTAPLDAAANLAGAARDQVRDLVT